MKEPRHQWNVSPREARAIQESLREQIRLEPLTKAPKYVAGADVSMTRFDTHLYAGFVVLSYPELEIIETSFVKELITFPYIPGLLSFREIPGLLKAFEALKIKPDLIFVDGHGIAHPRRLGIATHLGITLDIPTIGCAKSLLVGTFEEPGLEKGSRSPIIYKGETIGAAVRTKNNTKTILVSPGHNITLEESIELVLSASRGYRLPEPTRFAHNLVNEFRRAHQEQA